MRKPAPPADKTLPAAVLSDEDSRLFRETVGSVRVLDNDRAEPEKAGPKPRPHRHPQAPGWSDVSPSKLAPLAAGDVMSFVRAGLQQRVLRGLRSGDFEVEAEIDLHGHHVDTAKRSLGEFLQNCLAEGRRCVHLIHGKGYRSEGDYPVLKNHVNLWLRQHPDVLAFCTAKPVDGGTGAVYILLRVSRPHR